MKDVSYMYEETGVFFCGQGYIRSYKYVLEHDIESSTKFRLI